MLKRSVGIDQICSPKKKLKKSCNVFLNLCTDELYCILQFLECHHIFILSSTCKLLKTRILNQINWKELDFTALMGYSLAYFKENQISDECLVSMLKHMNTQFIEKISLAMYSKLTIRSVFAVLKFCPNVKELSLIGCESITLKSLNELLKNEGLSNLKQLYIRGISGLSNENLEVFLELERMLKSNGVMLDLTLNKKCDTHVDCLKCLLNVKVYDNMSPAFVLVRQ